MPPRRTLVEAARTAGLDFLAVTDHNTTSHHADLATLQESLDDLLVIRGQEGQTLELVRNGQLLASAAIRTDDDTVELPVPVDRGDWLHARVRDHAGITLISNPVYIR